MKRNSFPFHGVAVLLLALSAAAGCSRIEEARNSITQSIEDARDGDEPVATGPTSEAPPPAAGQPATTGQTSPSGQHYTRCNIWFEKTAISSINYKRGSMIPAGTPVSGIRIIARRGKPTVQFTAEGWGTFELEMPDRYNPGLSTKERQDQFITTKPLSRLTEGMNETELQSIRSGVLVEGLSRDAVLAAWGYPPAHKTPSLQGTVWTYWTSRFVEKKIHFGPDGRTSRPQILQDGAL